MNKSTININDIAIQANVSIATVSRYLNGHLEKMSQKTADNIKRIIEETGYVPNASAVQLMTQKSHLIAIVAADVDDYFSTEFFKGASSILEAKDYTGVLFDTNSSEAREEKLLQTINQQNFDGVILQPITNSGEHLRHTLTKNIPVVLIDREVEQGDYNSVVTDNFVAARNVAKFYQTNQVDQMIVVSEPIEHVSTRTTRWQGVTSIYPDADLVTTSTLYLNGDQVYKDLLSYLDSDKKQVIFFFKERLMLEILPKLIRNNLITDKLWVTGFSDTKLARDLNANVKLVEQNPFLMGASAAELLLKKIDLDQDKQLEKIVIPASY